MRSKQFDPNEVLDKAMRAFWSCGYEATSMRDLVNAVNVQRQSLYDTFESKRALYLNALRYYHDAVIVPNFASLYEHESPHRAIREYFLQRVKDIDDPSVINGCFVTNSVAELGELDEEIKAQLNKTLNYMEKSFYVAIQRAQKLGEIDQGKDAKLLAGVLLNGAQGLFVLGKSGLGSRKLRGIARQLLSVLD